MPTRRAVVVTGFGPFNGVADNPSSRLVERLREERAQDERVFPCVLETSMVGVRQGLEELEERVRAKGHEPDECVWVHLGVYAGQERLRLESQAFNDAHFRCADERGERPQHEQIVAADGPTGHTRSTSVDLETLCDDLLAQGFDQVAITDDPGRFVCNYVYYSSLARHQHALFVHIPQFDAVSFDTQFAFLSAIVHSVDECLLPNMTCPDELAAEPLSMGFTPTQVNNAYLAAGRTAAAGSGGELMIDWLLANADKPYSDRPCRTYADFKSLTLGADGAEAHKVVVVVNEELGMGCGKIASQVGHAALALNRGLVHSNPGLLSLWAESGEPLIVCKSPGHSELMALVEHAEACGLPTTPVRDAGRTEVASGSLTVVAFGPGPANEVDKVTGLLELL